MSFRVINKRYVEPIAQWTMVFGIVALCQPWIKWLHEWSVTITIVGLIVFIVSIHIPPPRRAKADEDSAGPVAASQVVKEGSGHG
jgi:hypothetical protein